MAGLIDKEAELLDWPGKSTKLEQDLARIEGKVGNASFVDKAPAAVVAKEREKMEAQKQALAKLQEQEQRIRTV